MRNGLCLAVVLLFVSAAAHAGTIHVPGDHTLLQAGIDAASAGDTVLVAAGTYDSLFYPPGADTARCVAYMKTGVTLLGAGIGQTIIDAQDQGRGVYCYGVSSGRIEGITVTNAFAQVYGAGIYCTQGSSPTIYGCEVKENGDGGIICTFSSSPDIDECVIHHNVYKEGGGIAIEDNSSPHITNTAIHHNSAPSAGGVFVRSNSAPVFEDCVIDSNFLTSAGSGGGVAVRSASITIRNCRITWNRGNAGGGGLDLHEGASATVESTVISDNETIDEYGPGGGIFVESSTLFLTDSEVSRNSAPGTDVLSDGGGIFAFFATSMSITGCTIVENTTKPGGLSGGIHCWFADPTIERTIIAHNSNGAGIYCDNSTPLFSCTDLYGNSGGDAICGTDVTGNFSQDPLFCDLAGSDYTLQANSPCLPGNHPSGDPCGLIGAYSYGPCNVGVDEGESAGGMIPAGHYARPNPFGPNTTIHFGLQRAGRVTLAIYNINGRRVRLLEDRPMSAGLHQVGWDARDDAGRPMPSGVYFYRLEESDNRMSGRLVLTR